MKRKQIKIYHFGKKREEKRRKASASKRSDGEVVRHAAVTWQRQ